MSVVFPTTLDSFTNPVSTEYLGTAASVGIASILSDLNDAIEAIEAKLGVNSSAVATSIDYKLTNTSSSNPGHKHTVSSLTSMVDLTTAQTLTTKTLTTPVLASFYQDAGKTKLMTTPNTASDTLVTLNATQTLTAKTLTTPTLTKPVINGTNPTGATYTPATGAQTVALDCAANNLHIVTGHASGTAITFTVANATNNQPFIVSILQGAVVSTITAWFATVRWAGGSAPTLTATVSKRDTFGFIRTGADTYDGFIIGQNC